MRIEPEKPRTIALIDGQNLFYAARDAFGYSFPNYDPLKLAKAVCDQKNWHLEQVRFYTGVPEAQDNHQWSAFWHAKLAQMGRRGVWTYSRPLRYRNKAIALPDGTTYHYRTGYEKGIDVRIALDVIILAVDGKFDVALIFSQDQDLSEVADEVRKISRNSQRWLKIASAFPASTNRRGINSTDWTVIDRETYDRCIDSRDYRVKQTHPAP